jgi:hypothetical protein
MNALTRLNKIGLGIAALLGVADVASAFNPTPEGEVGPPLGVLVVGAVLGVITLVGVGFAFRRGSRGAVRIVAASRVVSAILALPAFFVDIPAGLKIAAGAGVILTVAVVVMMLAPGRRTTLVTD